MTAASAQHDALRSAVRRFVDTLAQALEVNRQFDDATSAANSQLQQVWPCAHGRACERVRLCSRVRQLLDESMAKFVAAIAKLGIDVK